jgi:type IV secretory pathway protease TraF
MPVGLYLQTETTLERGSTVLVCLPDAITRVGRSRGYLPAGGCPNDSSPVVKQVLALPGDVVELHEQFVAVNRRLVEASGIGRS